MKFLSLVFCIIFSKSVFAIWDFSVETNKDFHHHIGNTIFAYNVDGPGIVEVNSSGEIVWEYKVPKRYIKSKKSNVMDVEPLLNSNILFVMRNVGLFEINRNGDIVWQYLDIHASHDADRLNNGNTIYVRGWAKYGDDQIVEVDKDGNIVWSWNGLSQFNHSPYKDIEDQGWMHPNSIEVLSDGNLLFSPRNFQMTLKLNRDGEVIWKQLFSCEGRKARKRGINIDHGVSPKGCHPHGPVIDSAQNQLLVALRNPSEVYIINIDDGEVVNKISNKDYRTIRDVDILNNGNILVQDNDELFEYDLNLNLVWYLKGNLLSSKLKTGGATFYKAERLN